MSESPNAIVTGRILATALAFKCRLLFPEFSKPERTFSQRRAVEKLCGGVPVFLHSKRGNDFFSFFNSIVFYYGVLLLKSVAMNPNINMVQIFIDTAISESIPFGPASSFLSPVQTSKFSCTVINTVTIIWVEPNDIRSTVDSEFELNWSDSIHYYFIIYQFNMYRAYRVDNSL